ncbi:MAG TPA: PQQ-binding-like beta-propeller repeat protein, partial [Candidatus Limnocylindrales bacterium]|nr:PQQ-binding-like beta-propeller repeat protein [Candidatus Limnocylindrales bacterium]
MTRRLLQAALLGAACLLFLSIATPAVAARSALALEPAIGPPTAIIKAKGSGFAGREVVALYFDGLRIGSDVTNPNGKFNTQLTVPASARPGNHTVEAVGQSSGVSARALFLVRTDWLQGCFEGGRSCFNPFENVLGPGNAGALDVAWRAPVGANGGSSPVYANGKLFVGTADGLVGLDPATGAIIINYRSAPVSTTPAVIRGFDPQPDPPGKVIFGSIDGILHAASTDGRPLWQAGLGAAPASPLVIQVIDSPNERVVVGAGNTLFAFDGNGSRLWATVLEGGDISKAAAVLVEPPDPDRVIAAAGNTLYTLDAATGQIVWATTPSGARLGAPSIGNPNFIGEPNALVGDQAGNLFSLDPRSGAIVAAFAAGGPITASTAIGDPDQSDPWVVLGDGGGNTYAFDTVDAFPPPIWQAALSGPVVGPPVLANGVVYVATDPEIGDPAIFGLDQASGRVLFDGPLPGGVASSPIVADGKLVVATKS